MQELFLMYIIQEEKQMNKNIKQLAYTGMFAAVIFVMTMFVKIPVTSGYLHLGDALIYIASLIIGPWAILAGALGEGLADVAGGYVMYAPATVIIKALIAVPFLIIYKKGDSKLLTVKSALMTLPAGVITVGGYFIADMIIDKAYAVVDIPGNIIQAVGSAVVFIIIALAFDKSKIKNTLNL